MKSLNGSIVSGPRGQPAVTTVRGFHTPVTSGDEDSDYSVGSTPHHTQPYTYNQVHAKLDDVVSETISAGSSPMLRGASSPGVGGISKLKLQLDTLNLDGGNGNGSRTPSMTRGGSHRSNLRYQPQSSPGTTTSGGSDDEASDVMSYEVPLEHDFVSADADAPKPLFGAVEGGLVPEPVSRKMAASDFDHLRCLGKGTYGTVLLVKQQSTGRLYAQKQFKKASLTIHKKLIAQTKTERAILESVNRHPFVVKLYYAFQDHEKLYLILEYAQGGELFTHLAQERMFTEEVASFYMAEMVLALEHLHTNLGVVYRDLKPENCLLDAEGHLLLTDFGLSKVSVDEDDHCNSILGTVEYMAPEVIEGKKYSFAVDWWSLGALGFDLLTGGPPFQGNNHAKILEKIVKSKLVMPYFLGPDAKDILTRFLRKEPSKRLGANMPKDLTLIKKHRFFRKIDWKLLAKREVEAPIQPLITDPELAENFSTEFTDLALSPVLERGEKDAWGGRAGSAVDEPSSALEAETPASSNPFGGFSYVASSSLLEGNGFGNFKLAV